MLIVVVDVSTSKWWWWSFVIIIFSLEEKNGSRSVPVKMHAMPGNNNAWYKCLSKGFYFSIRPWQSFLYCLRQVDMTSNNVRSHRCHKSAPHIAWGGKNDQVWPKQVAHCDAKLKPLTVICLVLRGDEHLSIAPLCGSFCPFPAHRKEVKNITMLLKQLVKYCALKVSYWFIDALKLMDRMWPRSQQKILFWIFLFSRAENRQNDPLCELCGLR